MFIHLVLFWLHPRTPEQVRRELEDDAHRTLSEIPEVKHVWAGQPAMTPREIVDNSYDVGLCVVVADKAGHDAYQDHPHHQEFIRKYKEHWQRVQVYDFQQR